MAIQTLQIRSPAVHPLEVSCDLIDISEVHRRLVVEVVNLATSHQDNDTMPESACLDLIQAVDYDVTVITTILLVLLKTTYKAMMDSDHLEAQLFDLELELVEKLTDLNVYKSNQGDLIRFVSAEIVSQVFLKDIHYQLKDLFEELSRDIELSTILTLDIKTLRSPFTGNCNTLLRVTH